MYFVPPDIPAFILHIVPPTRDITTPRSNVVGDDLSVKEEGVRMISSRSREDVHGRAPELWDLG